MVTVPSSCDDTQRFRPAAAGRPFDGRGLHVAQVRLEQLGVVGVEARIADQLAERQLVDGLVDPLALRVVEQRVVDAPGQQRQAAALGADRDGLVGLGDALVVRR